MEFLQRVYADAEGTHRDVPYGPISESLGLSDEQETVVIRYLVDQGFLDWSGMGNVMLTSKGIIHVEEMKEGHTEKLASRRFPQNINIGTLNVTGIANLGKIIGDINQHLTQINNSGNTAIAVGLKDFAEAVVTDKHLREESKKEVLEYLSTISEEAEKEPQKRKKGLMKMVLPAMSDLIKTSSSLITLWDKFCPQLYTLFDLLKQ